MSKKSSNSVPMGLRGIKSAVLAFRLITDEMRMSIIETLKRNEEDTGDKTEGVCVSDLCDLLSQTQPAVSHHLSLLRVSGTIEARREGKHNYYTLTTKGSLLATYARNIASLDNVSKSDDNAA